MNSLKRIEHFDGRALCSQRNPQREASQWGESQIISSSHIWVFGLGAGYHIDWLLGNRPNLTISVIETRKDLIDCYQKTLSEYESRILIEHIQTENDLINCKSFQSHAFEFSDRLRFYPAIQGEEKKYNLFERCLLGQTSDSCLIFSEYFEIGLAAKDIRKMSQFHIKEICAAVGNESEEPAREVFKILKELVV